jgi:hypothetical protein
MSDLMIKAEVRVNGGQARSELRSIKVDYDNLGTAMTGAAGSAKALGSASAAAATGQRQAAAATREAANASEAFTLANSRANSSMGATRAGGQQLGFQLQDVAVQYASGTNAGIIFAQQSGQIVQALALVGGGATAASGILGRMATFMGGPYGVALGVAVSVLGALAAKLFDTGAAADSAADKVDGLTGALERLRKEQGKAGDVGQAEVKLNTLRDERMSLSADLTPELYLRQRGTYNAKTFRIKEIETEISGLQSLIRWNEAVAVSKEKADKPSKSGGGGRAPRASRTGGAARAAASLDSFGDRSQAALDSLQDRFSGLSPEVQQANTALRSLDQLMGEIARKKPPNFEAMLSQARALKPIIQDSLSAPIDKMLADQEKQLRLGDLMARGRFGEAEALRTQFDIMQQLGIESDDQLATDIARLGITGDQIRQAYDNLAIMRQQTREIDIQQAKQRDYLGVLGDIRGGLEDAFASLRTEGPAAFGTFFDRLLGTFDQLFAKQMTQALFGDVLQQLEDQVTGTDKVSSAGDKMAAAVDQAAGGIDKARSQIERLGNAADKAAGKVSGQTSAIGDDAQSTTAGDIVVTGTKGDNPFLKGYEDATQLLGKEINKVFGQIFGEGGLFSAGLSKTLGGALGGAQVGGSLGTSIAKALGAKGGSTGGSIGGALGQVAGSAFFGPLGGAIGGLLGGIAGTFFEGLFKKAPTGAAVVTSATSQSSITGNNNDAKSAVSSVANTLQGALKQIAGQLGGDLGPFSVSIGKRNDYFRVSASGSQNVSDKYFSRNNADALYDGQDADAALRIALANALSDGAVVGISAAIQKALQSDSNLDNALSEALKVQAVELIASGPGGELRKALADFERQAKDRLRIAKDYGFDLVEIEKRNAQDRQKVVDDYLKSRITALSDFLKDVRYGSLAEGSQAEQRQVLLGEIATARANAENGVAGAADTLADLSRRLLELSREAFGTAGSEYGSDRSSTISAAERVIQLENDRVKAAQDAVAATNTKLDTANSLANEANDYLAQIAAGMSSLGYTAGGSAVTLADTRRATLV